MYTHLAPAPDYNVFFRVYNPEPCLVGGVPLPLGVVTLEPTARVRYADVEGADVIAVPTVSVDRALLGASVRPDMFVPPSIALRVPDPLNFLIAGDRPPTCIPSSKVGNGHLP